MSADHGSVDDTRAVGAWIIRWIEHNEDTEVGLHSPLAGSIDSLALASLLASVEHHFDVDVEEHFAVNVLGSVSALAHHVVSVVGRSNRTWFAQLGGDSGRYTLDPVSLVEGKTLNGETVLGASAARRESESSPGSLMATGLEAIAIRSFVEMLDALLEEMGGQQIWMPLITNSITGADHPQNVNSMLTSGRLQHAACLQVLSELPNMEDGLYGGIGYAFRREPARRWEPQGRLEAYRVFEMVWKGPMEEYASAQSFAMKGIHRVLTPFAATGEWMGANDGFSPELRRKFEWVAALPGGRPLAVASINDHADNFTDDSAKSSFCVGVGIDRMADAGLLRLQ